MPHNKIRLAYKHHRYAILFYSLLLSIVAVPVLTELEMSLKILTVFFAVNLMAAISPIASKHVRRILLLAILLSLFAQNYPLLASKERFLDYSIPAWTIVALLASYYALSFALRAKRVSTEQIYAALSAYLLAGIFLGNLYFAVERLRPGSFLVGGQPLESFPVSTAVYFSFVTLATLGYGDIVPHSEIARALTIIEAVAGQLYLAVMVARLVSLYVSAASEHN